MSFFVPPNDLKFRVLHQNIQSINSKLELLELAIQDLSDNKEEPDIICLSEMFIQSGNENMINLNNYKMTTAFSRTKRRGGTCILAKKENDTKELPYIKDMAVPNLFESCGIEVPKHKLVIICIYSFRTQKNKIEQFFNKLETLLFTLSKKQISNIIITGDLNINILKIT